MSIVTENYGHAAVLNLKGELTEDSLRPVQEAVEHCLADAGTVDIVLNMELVPFVDSKGLEFMLSLQDRLAERLGQVKLLRCDENITKILEITRLDSSFEQFKETTDAVKALQP